MAVCAAGRAIPEGVVAALAKVSMMAYPEKNVSYEHTPKFIDRMKAEERAGGGEVESDDANPSLTQTAHFKARSDFDEPDAMGGRADNPGMSLGEAQTDEVGAERRMQPLKPVEGEAGNRTDLRGGRKIVKDRWWPTNPSEPSPFAPGGVSDEVNSSRTNFDDRHRS